MFGRKGGRKDKPKEGKKRITGTKYVGGWKGECVHNFVSHCTCDIVQCWLELTKFGNLFDSVHTQTGVKCKSNWQKFQSFHLSYGSNCLTGVCYVHRWCSVTWNIFIAENCWRAMQSWIQLNSTGKPAISECLGQIMIWWWCPRLCWQLCPRYVGSMLEPCF